MYSLSCQYTRSDYLLFVIMNKTYSISKILNIVQDRKDKNLHGHLQILEVGSMYIDAAT